LKVRENIPGVAALCPNDLLDFSVITDPRNMVCFPFQESISVNENTYLQIDSDFSLVTWPEDYD